MASKQESLAALRATGVIAVIRTETPRDLVGVARALSAGGIRFVEITMTVPGALEIIRDAAAELKGTNVLIGAGTVLDAVTARMAILAGAQYIVSPGFDRETMEVCSLYNVLAMPGAFTATEIITAWKGGADVVKVFPADIGGPAYFRTLKEPLPMVELLPTRGVDLTTAGEFIKAGAIAVGAGGALVGKALMAAGDYAQITANAERFVAVVKAARGG